MDLLHEKVFADGSIDRYPRLERLTALRGERVSVQYAYTAECEGTFYVGRFLPTVEGDLAPLAKMSAVENVPVVMTVHVEGVDDNMERTAPGIYPDLISPLNYGGALTVTKSALLSAWIEINIPKDFPAGEHTLTVKLDLGERGCAADTVTVEVIAATLPDEDIYFTQWFHADCLAQHYGVPVWSERHWEIVENFARVAADNGINMLLTPVFTPPLDTAIGGERTTTQLVGVTLSGGEYSFDFSRLDRWIAMCDRVGIKYLEISHFFTQWGAAHAPKIIVNVDGEDTKLFGWHTDATSAEYTHFLRSFLTALLAHLRASGNDGRCFFHVSDEPGLQHLESYKAAKAIIADLLEGYTIIDALSNFDFYKLGVLEHPIPSSNHIEPFLEAKIPGLWTYYCVSQWRDVSNRYISMPLYRTRSIGMQMYKYNIEGFLHWGYNFYNNQFSDSAINPYVETSANFAFPAGDSYSVYPGADGACLESMRIKVFFEALQDIKAMKLCESLYSHGEVVAAIEETFGGELRFNTCAKSAAVMLAVREKINEMIKLKV